MSNKNSGITKSPEQESQTDVIQDVMNAVKNFKSDYESLKKEHSRLLAENRELKDKIEVLTKNNSLLQSNLNAQKNFNEVLLQPRDREIKILKSRVAELKEQIKTQSDEYAEKLENLEKAKAIVDEERKQQVAKDNKIKELSKSVAMLNDEKNNLYKQLQAEKNYNAKSMTLFDNLAKDNEELQEKLKKAEGKIEEFERKNEILTENNNRLINSLRAEKNASEVLLQPKNREIARLNAKIAELEEQVETQAENMKNLANQIKRLMT